MHRSLIAMLSIASVVATLAACSGAGSPTGSAAAAGGGGGGGGGGLTISDPCSLITQAEVSTALGQTVVAGSSVTDSHECNWYYPTADSTTGGSITIQDGDLASYCGKPSDPALGLTVKQESGVGDGACFTFVSTTTVGATFTFAKNGHVFTTTSYFGGGTDISTVEAADKALALAALGHM
jgi:hypothetical protein